MQIMLFKVVEKFGPCSGESWASYIAWRKFEFSSFDSIDGMLRPDLFAPETEEDWSNCVNANFKLNLITNLNYAQIVLAKYENARLVGVIPELDIEPELSSCLLGYDIIDGYCDVSLLTNWGVDDIEFINRKIQPNGLVGSFSTALELRNYLREEYAEDGHAEYCAIWAVYRVST